MTRSTGKRKFHFKDIAPKDPAVKRISQWPFTNVNFFRAFCRWLSEGGYSPSSMNTYGVAAKLALGWLDLDYWKIDPVKDLDRVRMYLSSTTLTAGTRRDYECGLDKFADYIRLSCHQPRPERPVHWDYYTAALPPWLAEAVGAFVRHVLRTRLPDHKHRDTLEALGCLTGALRWIVSKGPFHNIQDLTPERWFDYLEYRLSKGIQPVTLNHTLRRLQAFLHFLEDEGQPVCARMYLLDSLHEAARIPRDAPVELLRKLLAQIQVDVTSPHAGIQRLGKMDHAWVMLMLHSGLRTCEIRRLRLADITWESHRIRIEQSKGLKDRMVYLSQPTTEALQTYLAVRGSVEGPPDLVFAYRHQPLSSRYCQQRLRTYGKRGGLTITPHQLRHSCATLLLNAGAPILTVKTILGHKHIDTTLGYARLYDGTVAADYYRAMAPIEKQFALPEDKQIEVSGKGELLAMLDALKDGTLNENQLELLHSLRSGILALDLFDSQRTIPAGYDIS
jgi:site-specific recombinase XerD